MPVFAEPSSVYRYRWLWATLAAWLALFFGGEFVENFGMRPWKQRQAFPDFFQEWSSARNLFEGVPIYAPLSVPLQRYIGAPADAMGLVLINAHPPTSVLLALPFARLDFDAAFLAWNLVMLAPLAASLWVVGRQLNITLTLWDVFPAIVLSLLCSALWQQVRYGQLNPVLLLLVTGGWAADRTGRPRLAGALLGAAATIKLFPGYLLIYHLLRGRWTIVISGVLTVVALTLATAAILGVDAYRDYVRVVLPKIQWFRVGWENQSIDGFWSRLFDGAPETPRDYSRSRVLWYDPTMARAAYLISSAVITFLMAWATRRARTRDDEDRAFGIAVTAMLLLSPIVWEHYLLLLLVPLAVLWTSGSPRPICRVALTMLSAILFVSPRLVWTAFNLGGTVAGPIDNLTVIPYQCYALLGLFALGIIELKGSDKTVVFQRTSW